MYYFEPLFLLNPIFPVGLQLSSLSSIYWGEKSRWLCGVYDEEKYVTLTECVEERLSKRERDGIVDQDTDMKF